MDDKRLERIETKIDDMSEHLSSIDITLAAQHESLKDHIRRTEILEAETTKIKTHVDRVQGAFKFIGFLAVIAGIVEAIALSIK